MSARGGLVLLVFAALACSRDPEYDGIGDWRFTHTTLKDVTGGRCQPDDLGDGRNGTWCFLQPPIRIARDSRPSDVDLYFLGTEPAAKLIEIQLKIRGCREDDLEHWLRAAFGPPIQTKATRAYWKNSFLWIGALMPSDPGRCLVHVLPLSENAEIERIKQG